MINSNHVEFATMAHEYAKDCTNENEAFVLLIADVENGSGAITLYADTMELLKDGIYQSCKLNETLREAVLCVAKKLELQ